MKLFRQWHFILLLVFLPSCATVEEKKVGPEEISKIENLIAVNKFSPALKLSGRVSIKDFINGKGWSSTDASIALLRPYSLRASFHSKVGWSWFFAVSNPDEIGVSIPSRAISERLSRKRDGRSGSLKIGSFEISADDFIRFIHPGLDGEWVRDGKGRFSRGVLAVTYPGVEYLIRFDDRNRVEAVEIKRDKSKVLTARYSYLDGDNTIEPSVGVQFGNLLKFEFTKIVQPESFPPSFFEIPASLQ